MNECTAIHRLLVLRPDDWNEKERRQVEEHLQECADCRARAQSYAEQRIVLPRFPSADLTGPQQREFYTRLERKKRGWMVRSKLSFVLYPFAGIVILGAMALVVSILLQHGPVQGPVPGSSPTPSTTATATGTPDPYPELQGTPNPASESSLPSYDGPAVTVSFACYSSRSAPGKVLTDEFATRIPFQIIPLDNLISGKEAQRRERYRRLLSATAGEPGEEMSLESSCPGSLLRV